MRALVGAFTAYVRVTFGNQPEALADFGIPPIKATTPLTVEEKAKITGQVPATTPAAAPAPGVVPVNKA